MDMSELNLGASFVDPDEVKRPLRRFRCPKILESFRSSNRKMAKILHEPKDSLKLKIRTTKKQ